MKIFTNENNTSTLKLIIAANLAGKKVELKSASITDGIFTGPRQLPFLEVDHELSFFSSNAATQYLFPILDLSENGQCQQMQEWEATRLYPAVQMAVTSRTVTSELKQLLASLIEDVDKILAVKQFILGGKLSAADISIWSTLYPLYYNPELKSQFIAQAQHVTRWVEELALAKAVKDALTQWGGSAKGPFTPSCSLGIPQIPTLLGSPDTPEGQDLGITAEELEKAKEFWVEGLNRLQPYLKPEKVILPVRGRKNVLITSALPYVNNEPHLGNIIGCVLSADIFARYCRSCDYVTLFVCGTDEYGTATETRALQEGVSPRAVCDKYHRIHADVYRWFRIHFDYFGRTSTPQQTQITQHMFLKLKDNGFITTKCVDQLLCEPCDRYLADRFVEGTCPHPGCGYESARGDQCDRCGRLVTATELRDPRCHTCGAAPVLRNREQQFLDLAQLSGSVQTWAKSKEQGWSAAARAAARGWLRDGLRARCITRDLRWGVPVPLPGYEDKVFYVWFDAPIGYISITQCCTQQYERWWKPAKEDNVKLYQFMAKDNVPFHAVMFPAVLLGANEGYQMVDHLYATEYLNYEEGKFSKSRGVGVFGTDAQDTGIPADVWRFYLASIRPEGADSSFSWIELGTRNNSELLNNLGNFCHRSLSFCATAFGGRVPDVRPAAAHWELVARVNRELQAYVSNMEKGRLREALKHVLLISKLGNQHMQAEQPWVLLKGSDDEKERGASTVALCCQLVALLCVTLEPYTPDAALALREQLNLPQHQLRLNPQSPYWFPYLSVGHRLGQPEPLFSRLDPAHLEALRRRYAGTQAQRHTRDSAISSDLLPSVAELEAIIITQGERVRQIKASTKDKSAWQPEVKKLLDLKKLLEQALLKAHLSPDTDTAESLEKAISQQGDKVRRLKASTKDKAVWAPEIRALLDLKKRLANLHLTK